MRTRAFAKINLGLVVGPARPDGKHELATVLERVDLHDVVEIEQVAQPGIEVEGFAEDTLVRRALARFDDARHSESGWRASIEKHIPVSSGLGGGSSDAAAALRVANELTGSLLSAHELHEIAAEIGSDVPFFLTAGGKLATGDGTRLESFALPQDYWVVLALARVAHKESTGTVYGLIDDAAPGGFETRLRALRDALAVLSEPTGLAELPRNDLATIAGSSSLIPELAALGAFRADMSGAGPTVYGLFERENDASRAERELRRVARTWLARPVPGP
jgi:4-diphosphocytidyl-2-C-methyl-D-erythritol kinase